MQKYSIFIGIDLSKQWFDVALCVKGNLTEMPHRRFDQTQKGFLSFLEWVKNYAKKHHVKGKWICCMEHTGIYALALCHFLREQNQTFVLENPLRIKRSLGLRRAKSDKADALAIAEYAWRHQAQLSHVRELPDLLLIKLQTLLSLRARLVRYRQGLMVASNELRQCGQSAIYQTVDAHTVNVVSTVNLTINDVMKEIRQLIRQDQLLEKLYQLLLSVVGIGQVIAPYLLVHTNGFTAFKNPRSFACHVGIAPFEQSSGTSLQQTDEISQIANHRLKVLLSNAATVAVQHDPQIKAFFLKHKERGKEDGWIYHAVKNKIVHRVFAVIKRGTPYVKMDF